MATDTGQDTVFSANGAADQPVDAQVDQIAPAEETETEVDYKTMFEESERGRLKAEGDAKSTRGLLVSQQQRDATLNDRLEAQERSTLALARAMANNGDTDVSAEVSKIQAEGTQTRGQAQFQARSESLFADLEEAVKSDDGSAILDLHQAPELESVRIAWNEGVEKGDIGALSTALNSAHRIVRQAERGQQRQAVTNAVKAERDKVAKEATLIDQLDQSIPSGSPAGGMSDEDFMLQRVGNSDHDLTHEELDRAYRIRSKEGGF